jgi:hypothetical protein
VDISSALTTDLRTLTDGSDCADLESLLAEFVADARRAVRSYLGLTLTVVDGGRPFTMTVMNDGAGPRDVVSSAALPLSGVDGAESGSQIVFYAGLAGGLVDFAADLSYALQLPLAAVELDGHRPPPTKDGGLTGLAELMHLNQAAGTLIEMGFTVEEAHAELERVAHNAGVSVDHLAQQLIRTAATARKQEDDLDSLR